MQRARSGERSGSAGAPRADEVAGSDNSDMAHALTPDRGVYVRSSMITPSSVDRRS
ncbi:hypothetical protein FHY05_002878 [Sphingomonas sp. BK580]|nr:hypothetical protein [Sphingomonas sp. BK580]